MLFREVSLGPLFDHLAHWHWLRTAARTQNARFYNDPRTGIFRRFPCNVSRKLDFARSLLQYSITTPRRKFHAASKTFRSRVSRNYAASIRKPLRCPMKSSHGGIIKRTEGGVIIMPPAKLHMQVHVHTRGGRR